MYAKKRHSEKITMKKTIAEHSERDNKHKAEEAPKGAVPHYLLDREQVRHVTRGCVWRASRRRARRCARGAPLVGRSRCFRGQTLRHASVRRFCRAWSRIRTHTTEFCFSEAASGLCAESRHH